MNSLSFRAINCFNDLVSIFVVGYFLSNWYGPLFIWSIHFSKWSSRLQIIGDVLWPAGNVTIDVSDCNFFQSFELILGQAILMRFGILRCKAYFGTNRVSLFFFKICIFSLNMRDIIIYVARWWEKYLWKRSLIKHTCSWRDKRVVLWTLNRQAKIFLPIFICGVYSTK